MESSILELVKWWLVANVVFVVALYALSAWSGYRRRWGTPQPRPKAPRDCWKRTGKREAWRMEDGE